MSAAPETSSKKESLPFDPITVLLGLRRKLKWIALILVVAIAVGVGAGVLLGRRSWDSYCVMLYQPPSVELSGRVYEAPAVQTQLNLVKLRSNLDATRERLRLGVTLETLASACDISNPRDTQLLIVKGTADSASQSAAIANTLAEVFIDNQRRVRDGELSEALNYLEGRRRDLMKKLEQVQKHTGVAAKEPGDLDREIRSFQTKLDALDVIYEKALAERQSLEMQVGRVSDIMEETKQKIADEQSEAAAVQGLSNLNIRVERIREAIMDARSEQTNDITLAQWKERLDYDKRLLDQGYLSQAVYNHEQAQYEKLKAQAVDSEQIATWKQELEELYAKIRPANKKETASAPILRDLMMRAFNLELAFKGNQELIVKTKQSRDSTASELEQLLQSRSGSGAQQWQVQSWRDELADVDRSIAMVQSLREAGAADFQIVSPAVASPLPNKSTRRLLAIGAAGFFGMLGFAAVVATELGQTRIRTRGELANLLADPVVAVIADTGSVTESSWSAANHEQIRSATRALLQNGQGNRILMLGCHRGDGCSTITKQIAGCLARQRKRVTIVEADLRGESRSDDEFESEPAPTPGLAELLDQVALPVQDAMLPTDNANLSVVCPGRSSCDPDLLGSQRMGIVVSELTARSDYLIIDGPPVSESTDADYLAVHADAIVLVVRSGECSRFDLKRLVDRLRNSGTPLLGIILNQVDPLYV